MEGGGLCCPRAQVTRKKVIACIDNFILFIHILLWYSGLDSNLVCGCEFALFSFFGEEFRTNISKDFYEKLVFYHFFGG